MSTPKLKPRVIRKIIASSTPLLQAIPAPIQAIKVPQADAVEFMSNKRKGVKRMDPILVCEFPKGYRETKQHLRVAVSSSKIVVWERQDGKDTLGVVKWSSTQAGSIPKNLKLKDWENLKKLCDEIIPICQQEHIIESVSKDCKKSNDGDEGETYDMFDSI